MERSGARSITIKGGHFKCRQIFTLDPDVILNTKFEKQFGSHNGFLVQSQHHSEKTKNQINHYDETKKSTLS